MVSRTRNGEADTVQVDFMKHESEFKPTCRTQKYVQAKDEKAVFEKPELRIFDGQKVTLTLTSWTKGKSIRGEASKVGVTAPETD